MTIADRLYQRVQRALESERDQTPGIITMRYMRLREDHPMWSAQRCLQVAWAECALPEYSEGTHRVPFEFEGHSLELAVHIKPNHANSPWSVEQLLIEPRWLPGMPDDLRTWKPLGERYWYDRRGALLRAQTRLGHVGAGWGDDRAADLVDLEAVHVKTWIGHEWYFVDVEVELSVHGGSQSYSVSSSVEGVGTRHNLHMEAAATHLLGDVCNDVADVWLSRG